MRRHEVFIVFGWLHVIVSHLAEPTWLVLALCVSAMGWFIAGLVACFRGGE